MNTKNRMVLIIFFLIATHSVYPVWGAKKIKGIYDEILKKSGWRFVTPEQFEAALEHPEKYKDFIKKYGVNSPVQLSWVATGGENNSLLEAAISRGKRGEKMALALIKEGAKVNQSDLDRAVSQDMTDVVKEILKQGVPISYKAMVYILKKNNPTMIDLLGSVDFLP